MIERHTLENGLKILGQKSEGTLAASILVVLKTGSRNETPKIHGISHFLEHMCFKGTKRRKSAPDIAREIDSMGAKNNAFTSKEFTGYYIQANEKYFEQSLDILSDMAFHSVLSQEEIKRESGTIIEEINMYEDTPMYNISDVFEEILFENQQIAQNVTGEKEVIKLVTSDAMKKYRDKFYRAGNTIVACAGSLPDNYISQIERYFGLVPSGKLEYAGERTNKMYSQRVRLSKKDTEQAHIYMGCESYDINNSNRYALDLLTTIMGGNMSSRLFIEVREKRGLAYYLKAASENNYDTGMFTVRAGLNVDKTEEAVRIIKEELLKARSDIKEEELKRAKDYVFGTMALSEENSMNVAEQNGLEEIIGGEALPLDERIKLYQRVSLDDILNVANDVFNPDKLKLAVIGPYETPEKFAKILKS